MHETDNHRSLSVEFLLQLSSLVQSLKIYQQYSGDINEEQMVLWGIQNFDWTSAIIEMFSKKLDKLQLDCRSRLPDDVVENLKMVFQI